jgi:hypothetical protein
MMIWTSYTDNWRFFTPKKRDRDGTPLRQREKRKKEKITQAVKTTPHIN